MEEINDYDEARSRWHGEPVHDDPDPDLQREEEQQAAIWSWIESGDMSKLARLPK